MFYFYYIIYIEQFHGNGKEKYISWNFFATSHGKGAVDGVGGRIKRDVHTASLAKGAVIQNLDDFVQVSESITVFLECTKKHVESLVNQIDKDTIYCAGITGLRKPGIHCIKVLAPYVIETKVHYYSSSTPRKSRKLQRQNQQATISYLKQHHQQQMILYIT